MPAIVSDVELGSIADEIEIEAGDEILSIDGCQLTDLIDYNFYCKSEFLTISVKKINGELEDIEIEKDYDEPLGIIFESAVFDKIKPCLNKCIFCFVDQQPKGLRKTLYIKDDDYRLSYLQGTYITLTNLKEEDKERIAKMHLGPLYVSVHTTNPDLRVKMLRNPNAKDIMTHLKWFRKQQIPVHCQIVLCPGYNDGKELEKTIQDLYEYAPIMSSVSVVPAGLTKFRDGLYPLEMFDKKDAESVIDMVESFQKKFYEESGIHFIQASDEWYILAERDFPEEERYDGYIQLENGVGMMRLLWTEFLEALERLDFSKYQNEHLEVSLATGVLAYDMIREMSDLLEEKVAGLKIHTYKIINHYFGETITVSGLITATDLMDQLKDVALGERLILPNNILRSGEDVFLDDYTLTDVEKSLNINIVINENSGEGFIKAVLDGASERGDNGNFVYIDAYPS